jgi:hypothetical protein
MEAEAWGRNGGVLGEVRRSSEGLSASVVSTLSLPSQWSIIVCLLMLLVAFPPEQVM